MDNLKDLYVAGIAAVAAFLYWLGNYDKNQELSKGQRARKLLYGAISSSIVVWGVFELLAYLGVPFRLSLAMSGFVSFYGGEKIADLAMKYIEARINKKVNE